MALDNFDWEMTWAVGFRSRYESSWMACHRFLWLNALAGAELYELLVKSAKRKPTRTQSNFEEYIKSSLLIGTFSRHIEVRSATGIFGMANVDVVPTATRIRYCPECLKNLFHSPIFQILRVKACPVHFYPPLSIFVQVVGAVLGR
jgi:hypothetical protein